MKWLRSRTCVLLGVAFATAGVVAALVIHTGTRTDPFTAWKESKPDDRHPAAERLVADGSLIGMGVDELLLRLGPPTHEFTDESGRRLDWVIGDPPGTLFFTMDTDYMTVEVVDGKVTSVRIWTAD